jgi:hypothetical protein
MKKRNIFLVSITLFAFTLFLSGCDVSSIEPLNSTVQLGLNDSLELFDTFDTNFVANISLERNLVTCKEDELSVNGTCTYNETNLT